MKILCWHTWKGWPYMAGEKEGLNLVLSLRGGEEGVKVRILMKGQKNWERAI